MSIRRVACRWLDYPRMPMASAVLAVILTLPALWVGWQSDDFLHQLTLRRPSCYRDILPPPPLLFSLVDGNPPRTHRLMNMGWLPWWSFEELRLAFCRPLTAMTHWLDYQLWPTSPFAMHAHSLLWFGLLVAGAAMLYRAAAGPTRLAALAAFLFAVDRTHGLAAGWLANRNGLMAAAFGTLALVAHLRWRTQRSRVGAVLAPLALLAGLLSGELAVAAIGYLFAYALCLEPKPWSRRITSLVPCALAAIVWMGFYRITGFGIRGSSWYVDPNADPVRFLSAVLERAPILLTAQWGLPPAGFYLLLSARAARLVWAAALLFLVLLLLVIMPLLKRDGVARWWALGMLLATIPACTTVPSDRLLLMVSLGAMGLLARFLAEANRWFAGLIDPSSLAMDKAVSSPGFVRRRLTPVMAGLLILIHMVVSPLALSYRAWSPALLGQPNIRALAALSADPQLGGKTVVLLNAPSAMGGFYFPAMNVLDGRPAPAHIRVLTAGLAPPDIRRRDDRTLIIRPRDGFLPDIDVPLKKDDGRTSHVNPGYLMRRLDRLVRDDRHPFTVGQRIELTGMTVEVTALTADGRPAEAAFHFSAPLEDPSLRWFRWDTDSFVPFTPPKPAETLTVPARPVHTVG